MIVKCPRLLCGVEFENKGKYGIRKFCSRTCANTRPQTAATKAKIAASVSKYIDSHPDHHQAQADRLKSYSDRAAISWVIKKEKRNKLIESLSYAELTTSEKRERILSEQNCKCSLCGILQHWNNKPLKFELDHISGDRQDNSRENLRLICPNCHSQTATYKVKNVHRVVNDQDFIQALQVSESIYDALRLLKMSLHGGNYVRARNLVRKYHLTLPYLLM